ncbi:Scramblase-domain-containing protein [Amylostereum chailletii]|nr:Scramblase-domain-containing protein [Amylostereum chailletii]
MLGSRLSRGLSSPLPHNRIVYPHPFFRQYALSRFPNRHHVGSGRSRNPPPQNPFRHSLDQNAREAYSTEDQPSSSTSPLWEPSERRLLGSPEGLKRLLLKNNSLVVTRQLEMLNIFIGFEQTNKYTITNAEGERLGFIVEEPHGLLASIGRQIFRTHRPFRAIVMDQDGVTHTLVPILQIRRPFDWINSRMFVQRLKESPEHDSVDEEPVLETFAEGQQSWHLWRRRYDLFLKDPQRRILSVIGEAQPEPDTANDAFSQFAKVDEGLWAWNFALRGAHGEEIASVNRVFRGLGREACLYDFSYGTVGVLTSILLDLYGHGCETTILS